MSDRLQCPHCEALVQMPYEQTDAYWLRVYAGQAMQGYCAHYGFPAEDSVRIKRCILDATALLKAIKEAER